MYTPDVSALDRLIKYVGRIMPKFHDTALVCRDDVILVFPTEPLNSVWLVHAIDRPFLDVDAFGGQLDGKKIITANNS